MATSDSEAFESADEDFDFDLHVSSEAHKKNAVGSSDSSNIQKNLDESFTTICNEENAECEKSEVIDDDRNKESTNLVDCLKSLQVDGTALQVKDGQRDESSDDKSDSSDSNGDDDSVRTLKQGPVRSITIKNEPNKEGKSLKDSVTSSATVRDETQTEPCSDTHSNIHNVRKNMKSRKQEHKRPQTTREAKQTNAVKKLGTKITPKLVSPVSDCRTINDSIGIGNERKESIYEDGLEKTKMFEKLLDSAVSSDLKADISTSTLSEKTEEKISSVLEKLADTSHVKESSGWGGWGNWGVSSLLSTATESVSSLTSQVTHGFSTVLETGIGIPDPEELARLDKEHQLSCSEKSSRTSDLTQVEEQKLDTGSGDKSAESQSQDGAGLFGFGRVFSGVSSITKLVESTGSKVITGGLDTLETIGKKTMEVLQEGDPGLRKKREIFSDKIILSQVLREAKEKAEMEDKLNEDIEVMRKAHFETLFDDYQGLVHLEALEMLSKQCELKVEAILQSLAGHVAIELHDKMTALKEFCEIPDDDEDDAEEKEQKISGEWLKTLNELFSDLGVTVSVDKVAKIWAETTQWLNDHPKEIGAQEIHHKAISALARLTAISVEQFHKTAELLLVKEDRDPFQEAHCLQEMTLLLSFHISVLAGRFSDTLTSYDEESPKVMSVNEIITNIFFEASNSSSYVKEAFQLIIPVLQLGLKL